MSKTEDQLEQAQAAGNGRVGADAAVTHGAATTTHGKDAAPTLPLAAYVPMGAVSRYEKPKAAIKSDTTKSWISRAAPVVMSHKKQWFAALIFAFAGLMVQVWIPLLLQNGITDAIVHNTAGLRNYVILIGGLGLLTGGFGYISRSNLFKVAYAIEFDLRNMIYEHFTRMSFPFYDRVQSGQLISRANSDIRSVQMYLTFAPMILVQCSIAIVAFCFMLSISVPLAFVAMASMPFIYVVGVRMRRKLFPVSWLIQSRLAEVATVVDENVNGVRVVRSFAAEQQQLGQLGTAADRVQWAYIKDADLRARFTPLVQNLSQVGLALVLLVGGYMIIHDHLPVATLISFNLWLVMMQAPFMMLGMLIMMGQRASASAARIYEILDEQPTIVDRPDATDLVDTEGDVVFDDVTFAYAADSLLSKPDEEGRERAAQHLEPPRPAPPAGRDRGHGRPHRQRQVLAGPAPAPLLRRHRGGRAGRRPRRARRDAHQPAGEHRHGPGRALPLFRLHSGQHHLRQARCIHGGGARRGRGGRGRRLHRPPARGLRHGRGRARLHAVGWTAPAHRHRAGAAREPAHPDPRRRHERHRREGRTAHPLRAACADGRTDHPHHRPPLVDDLAGRPGHPARRRADRGGRNPRRAPVEHAALQRGAGAGGERGADGRARRPPDKRAWVSKTSTRTCSSRRGV